MPTAADTQFFQDVKPAAIRVWHWLLVVFFFSSIITVLFGSTLFKTKPNVAMVQEQVQQKGGTITEKQAWGVAHEYSDKLWMLHKYIGYGLSLLLLWRIITEISLSKEKKLAARIHAAMQYPGISPETKHYKMVQYSYLVFYGLFLVMALTGLILAYEDIEFLKPIHEPAEEIHGFVQYGLYGFIIFHIIGVIRADLGRYGGIVSRMINGK
jgi:Ni/Fe-hydrogenase 1 B-type cytochrome subunit